VRVRIYTYVLELASLRMYPKPQGDGSICMSDTVISMKITLSQRYTENCRSVDAFVPAFVCPVSSLRSNIFFQATLLDQIS
jgi:hypothetical protein